MGLRRCLTDLRLLGRLTRHGLGRLTHHGHLAGLPRRSPGGHMAARADAAVAAAAGLGWRLRRNEVGALGLLPGAGGGAGAGGAGAGAGAGAAVVGLPAHLDLRHGHHGARVGADVGLGQHELDDGRHDGRDRIGVDCRGADAIHGEHADADDYHAIAATDAVLAASAAAPDADGHYSTVRFSRTDVDAGIADLALLRDLHR
mmetsp:Transcript_61741/g.177073  ORF Transcript_61741/g.177073 Transcript_61741/m.177073 type:complete len:202 (+) Transcript_61741:724-1329(+)